MSTSVIGVAQEDIPAGAMVDIDPKTGRIRRRPTPDPVVHQVTVELHMTPGTYGDPAGDPFGTIVCACGEVLLTLDSGAAFDVAAETVTKHLEAAR